MLTNLKFAIRNLQFAIPRVPSGRLSTLALLGGVFGLGVAWGSGGMRLLPTARADVEEQTPTQHFLAGGERADITLKEILGVMRQDIVIPLKQMESRLARIEAIAEGKPVPPPVDTRRLMKGTHR